VETRPHPNLISPITTSGGTEARHRALTVSLSVNCERAHENASQDRSVTFNHLTLINKTDGNLSGYKNRRYSSASMSNV